MIAAADKKIAWLASYPKSGNTWTRILLSNLLYKDHVEGNSADDPKDDGVLKVDLSGSISSSRQRFDNLTGLPSSDLSDDEIDQLRPGLYTAFAEGVQETQFIKVHDAYHDNVDGVPIFPAGPSIGAIYLVRNPMDVAISYAFHQGHENFAKVVKQLGHGDHSMAGGNKQQLRQKTLGWSGHYRSWMEQGEIPVLCIRYEDMLADTADCLQRMGRFLGLAEAHDRTLVDRAVALSSFERLQGREAAGGFTEKPEKAARFFRSGKAGEGREKLSAQLQEQIIAEHGAIMRELGYLAG